MGRAKKRRALDVWMNGELTGSWVVASSGQHEFEYAESWLVSPRARPLSLSMPLGPGRIRGEVVANYFDNLLPDSELIRQRAQSRYGAASTQAIDLLTEIGRDCVGAVQLLGEGSDPVDVRTIEGEPVSEEQVAQLLRDNLHAPVMGQAGADTFRISIAGAQEKTALLMREGQWMIPTGTTPTTHILKQPIGNVGAFDMSTSVENEWLCSVLMREFGCEIAACEMAIFDDQQALVVERFDRKLSADGTWWLRLPQEDMCQAMGASRNAKYESDGGPGVEPIMDLLLGSQSAAKDRRRFFEAQVLFWVLGAIDGHAKNFSVSIEALGRYRMTPLYDVLSAYPVLGAGTGKLARQDMKMAMAIRGKNRHYKWASIQRRHWLAMAQRCGLGVEVEALLSGIVDKAPKVVSRVARELPSGFPAVVADSILGEVEAAAGRLG